MAKRTYGDISFPSKTGNKALILNASKELVESSVTDTELGYVSGVTSALQTQLNAKEALISGATVAAVASGDTLAFTDIDDSNNTKKITFANIEATLNHDSLAGFVANEHVDHSSVSITTAADSGLTGGGDITATRTVSVDITGTTGGTLSGTDEVLVWNGSALRKQTASEIGSLGGTNSFKATWADTDGATKSITHSLGTTDVIVQIFDIATGDTIIIDDEQRTDANTLDLTASEAPAATDWRVLILAV